LSPVTPVFPRRAHDFVPPREVVFGKDQPQYQPLPAVIEHGLVTTRWKLTWREKLQVALTGNLWLSLLTFNHPLQPIKLSVYEPASVEE
jgi:hypothetical protein